MALGECGVFRLSVCQKRQSRGRPYPKEHRPRFCFDYPEADDVREYLTDKLTPEARGEIEKVVDFSRRVSLNYDCLRAIAFELNEGETFSDAIGYRAFAFGIMDEHIILSRHIQRYDVFHDYVQRVYTYILKKLNADFNQGITNAAGYLYISAMAAAVQRNNGMTLFSFDETISTSGKIPIVDSRYQAWINAGYETGKNLFLGFIEYVNLRHPKGDFFDGQLRQSFLDMTLYGSTQANKDMNMGIPVSDKPEISGLKIAVQNLLSSHSPDNMRCFAKVLKSYIDEGTWVHIPETEDKRGFRMRIVESRGKHFAALYSDSSEIRSNGKENIVETDINKFIDSVFQSNDLDGIVIDPDTISLCLEKHFLLQCILHGSYPEVNNGGSPQRDWGTGIPKYTKDDLMTAGEIQNFAMHAVIDNDRALQQRYDLISACDYPGAMPSMIFGDDNSYLFIYIKGYVAMTEPTLNDAERSELKSICEKYNAKGYWAPVGFLSTDSERCEKNLALKGDGFYCKYQGLREV